MVPGSQEPACLSLFKVAVATMTPVIIGHFNIHNDDSLSTPVSPATASILPTILFYTSPSPYVCGTYDSHGQKYPRTCDFGGSTV